MGFENRGDRNENPPNIGFWKLLREDLRTHENDIFSQGFWAIAVHRFGNWRMGIGPKLVRAPFSLTYKLAYKLVQWTCGIQLPYTVKLGRRVHIWHFGGLILSARSIGDDCHLRHSTTCGVVRRGADADAIPTIGDRVDIGAGAVIVGPILIGDDSIIGANAVVLESLPSGTIAVGNPARALDRSDERRENRPMHPPERSSGIVGSSRKASPRLTADAATSRSEHGRKVPVGRRSPSAVRSDSIQAGVTDGRPVILVAAEERLEGIILREWTGGYSVQTDLAEQSPPKVEAILQLGARCVGVFVSGSRSTEAGTTVELRRIIESSDESSGLADALRS